MPIDGLASGLDTNAIITQLMALERQPRDRIQARRDGIQAGITALDAIEAKFAEVATSAQALDREADWSLRTATSSAPQVTVTATGSAAPGSFSFTVNTVAASHGEVTAQEVAATSAVVAGGGSIVVHDANGDHTVSVGTGTLDDVAAGISGAGLGLRAAIVSTGTGFRLQITSTATGAATAFSVTSGLESVGGTVTTTQGADTRITVGTGPGAYSVTSATNSLTNLLPGVTVTVNAQPTDPVVIQVASDVKAIGDKVKAMVDAVNAALDEVKARTSYDAKTKTAAALTGDSAVRRATQALSRAVSDAVEQSPLKSAGLAGVTLDRYGKLTFDRVKFEQAFAADPAAVQRLFVQGAATTGSVEFVGATDATGFGTADVTVQSNPTAATGSGWATGAPQTVNVRVGGVTATYTIPLGATGQVARDGLQAALDAAGITVDVTTAAPLLPGSAANPLTLTQRNAGYSGFEVAWDGATYQEVHGTDIVGDIGGVTTTGVGWLLTASPDADSPLAGLSVRVTQPGTGVVGTVSYEPGIAQRIATAVAAATNSSNGYLTTSESTRATNVKTLDATLDAYDRRLTAREALLRKQFAALEVAIGNMKNQSAWLSGQLAQLNANAATNKSDS